MRRGEREEPAVAVPVVEEEGGRPRAGAGEERFGSGMACPQEEERRKREEEKKSRGKKNEKRVEGRLRENRKRGEGVCKKAH